MNTTTRCYPRTALRQSDAAYGASIERHKRRSSAALSFTYVLAVWELLCAVFVWGQP